MAGREVAEHAEHAERAEDTDGEGLRRDVVLTIVTGGALAIGISASALGAPPIVAASAYVLAYLAGGGPASLGALDALRRRTLSIDLLMVLAAVAAAAVGAPRDGAILLFLFSLAGTLEAYALGRTKRAVDALLKLRPDVARRRRDDGATETVSIEHLGPGDLVLVEPGERLPADGVVVEGASAIDQAAITGESVPVDRAVGDEVFAATVNGHGALMVRVTKRAGESTVARMIELVTEARSRRSPSQRVGDWFGQRYTAFVLGGSALAFLIFLALGREAADALYTTATLLVAASPCAVVISVPAAVLSALAAAARGGVLFKGGGALEALAKVDVVALDKTGTLTFGRPVVTEVVTADDDIDGLLRLAAALERRSEHPIARAVVAEADRRGLSSSEARDATAVPGLGIVGTVGPGRAWAGTRRLAAQEGHVVPPALAATLDRLERDGATVVVVGDDHGVRGVVAVADNVRPTAADALARLREAGVGRIAMLTGDHAGAAHAVAASVGIGPTDVHAGLLPEDKVRLVEALTAGGERIAYVGDGVNDAAALARADVGIAMGAAGSDVAIETADVALLADDLGRLEVAYRLAKRADRIVRQNLVFALGAMVVLVTLTLFGDLPLPVAVVGHEGGTLVVVANGLRLLAPARRRRGGVRGAGGTLRDLPGTSA